MLNNNPVRDLDETETPAEEAESRAEAWPQALDEVRHSAFLSSPHPHAAKILSRPYFLWVLRRERLRSDRCGAPLSIALLQLDDREGDGLGSEGIQCFLEY